jgi:hypothetical protein
MLIAFIIMQMILNTAIVLYLVKTSNKYEERIAILENDARCVSSIINTMIR